MGYQASYVHTSNRTRVEPKGIIYIVNPTEHPAMVMVITPLSKKKILNVTKDIEPGTMAPVDIDHFFHCSGSKVENKGTN